MPILDGGSSAWCDALGQLNIPPALPRARVARSGVIDVGSSHYEFEPFEGVEVEVDLVSSDLRLSRHARWDGGETDFRCGSHRPERLHSNEISSQFRRWVLLATYHERVSC